MKPNEAAPLKLATVNPIAMPATAPITADGITVFRINCPSLAKFTARYYLFGLESCITPERKMSSLLVEIDRLEKSIVEIDAAIPVATGNTLETFIFHRNWHRQILTDYKQAINASRT
jgi:hypothetical protein